LIARKISRHDEEEIDVSRSSLGSDKAAKDISRFQAFCALGKRYDFP